VVRAAPWLRRGAGFVSLALVKGTANMARAKRTRWSRGMAVLGMLSVGWAAIPVTASGEHRCHVPAPVQTLSAPQDHCSTPGVPMCNAMPGCMPLVALAPSRALVGRSAPAATLPDPAAPLIRDLARSAPPTPPPDI